MPKFDLLGHICIKCNTGCYDFVEPFDEWDNILHCTECGHEVKRYVNKRNSIFD